jgi:hypothetical protein
LDAKIRLPVFSAQAQGGKESEMAGPSSRIYRRTPLGDILGVVRK